jgi:hypothetical protein
MSYTGNPIERFNLGRQNVPFQDPEYQRPYGSKLPALRAYGNVTYLQLIDIISNLWHKAHPELKIVPYGSREKFDPEVGYIIYNLDQKIPTEDNTKPRHREDIAITDDGEINITTFTQSFMHLIEFTAVHRDPRTAEEILEAFEDFMMIITPEIVFVGAEKFLYNRRMADRDETRYGVDVAARSVMYSAVLQKMIMVRYEVLESIQIEVRILRDIATPEFNEVFVVKVPPEEV